MAKRAGYPSDVTDGPWELMVPVLARNGVWGRPREVDLREVVKWSMRFSIWCGRAANGVSCHTTFLIPVAFGITLTNGATTEPGRT